MGLKIWLDGKLVDEKHARVSVFDHGLLYGDGVFEGIRAYHGRVFRLDEHLARLYDSAKVIALTIPLTRAAMRAAVLATLRANRITDGYIRLVVTRGPGDLGIDPRKSPKPTVFVIAAKIVLYPQSCYDRGMAIITAATRRVRPDTLSPRVKSLNYLNNILAKLEANRQDVPEALMLSTDGYVVECTGDNIFLVRGKKLVTPPVWLGALEGVTRNAILELAGRHGLEVREEPFTLYEVYTADECFLTGTAAEAVPVVSVDARPIGTGKPGPVTRRLVDDFKALTRRDGAPIAPSGK